MTLDLAKSKSPVSKQSNHVTKCPNTKCEFICGKVIVRPAALDINLVYVPLLSPIRLGPRSSWPTFSGWARRFERNLRLLGVLRKPGPPPTRSRTTLENTEDKPNAEIAGFSLIETHVSRDFSRNATTEAHYAVELSGGGRSSAINSSLRGA